MNIKFGACEWALPGNGVASLKLAKQMGLEGLQLGFISYERGFLLSQPWFRAYYKEEAQKYGILLPSLAVCEFDNYGLKNPKSSEKGKIAREIIELAVEAAADLNMNMVMMPSFVDGFIDTDEDLCNTADALRYACDLAITHDIIIATENLLTLARNNELLRLTDRKNLSCFYDSQNYKANLGWDQAPMLEGLYDSLYPEIHVKDGVGSAISCRLLGQGDSDFAGTMRILKNRGYAGWIHLENYYDRLPLRSLSPNDYTAIIKRDLEILKGECS